MPRDTLDELLPWGQSPYFGMFRAGFQGYSLEDAVAHCNGCGIPLREKDIRSWQDGNFKHDMYASLRNKPGSLINPVSKDQAVKAVERGIMASRMFDTMKLEDFNRFPEDWNGTERRFFPCTEDNRPMCQWGWKDGFDPNLMPRADAKALSPCGWVGQNMLYQKFIVMDIDGAGHGEQDDLVIEFGNRYRNTTLTYEDPKKPGSFHLYFSTDRILPVKHFPYAKLDFMGNAVNAAVYFKNKQPNGLPMAELTPEIWDDMMRYQSSRKESNNA